MRQVYLVTHTQASHHVDEVVGGWYDSELTPYGMRAAAAVGARIRALIPAGAEVEIYSSDLRRAVQTAAAVGAALDVRPVHDERLREKSYGEAEGRPEAWFRATWPLWATPATSTGWIPVESDWCRHDEQCGGRQPGNGGTTVIRVLTVPLV